MGRMFRLPDPPGPGVLARGDTPGALPPGRVFLENPDLFAERVRSLTPAQRAILGLVAQGQINKQIAHRCGISEATVKAHISAVLGKLGERSRVAAAVRFAVFCERESRRAGDA
ncbi:hypothetical protein GCM10007036_30700 [Alsobacter metallidurans]|uniref:HTH luxR-type domain-containing protein n=1 Tax=Alsobacter metallidurans TaxID=340221 RepID=A0A917I7Y4_9HYPH|nr:helix-turn-helix transcriptional regulator [Alsobacter metallidurans]GGH24348.1 hypothetical protein GCM10007036_30700 [Alsobacter metallidurans]